MKSISTLFFLVLASFAFTQSVDFTKENFKERKSELKDAQKNIDLGDEALMNELPDYATALGFYQVANTFNPNNAELNFKLGLCFINGNQKFKAIEYFLKAEKLKPTVDPNINYYVGRGYQLTQKWDEAIVAYQNHKKTVVATKQGIAIEDATRRIEECKNGKNLSSTPVRVWIDNMGKVVNSTYPEYGMIMNADGSEIYYTSRRPNESNKQQDDINGGYYEDIYYAKRVDGVYSVAKNVGSPINTDGHDATVSLNSDGSKMIIYLDDNGDGNLYESYRKGDTWSKPKILNSEICSEYHESSAWYSADNQKLYFVSNRPLTKKGAPKDKDIYVATWNAEKEKWDNITRLPETINTPYNEDGIFLHPDGKTLYFSSQGHSTMGGYDVFYTVLQDNGSWSTPVNIGYPINTPDDDIFFVVSASGRKAYMTSFREDGIGEKDLYQITFLGEEKKPLLNSEDVLLAGSSVSVREIILEPKLDIKSSGLSLLKGTIIDAKTKKPLAAKIELYDIQNNMLITEFTTNAETGNYLVTLPAGKNYGIAVKVNGYLFHSENFNLPKESDYQEFVKNVEMKKLEIGEVIVLRNIFFDLGKYSLRPESQNELDRLTKLMVDNPTLRIQMSGHTDSRGSDAVNKELSLNRAKEVVDYLVGKGIDKKRMEFAGFGEEQPIISDAEIAKLKSEKAKEDAHQSNRRTEFKIIGK